MRCLSCVTGLERYNLVLFSFSFPSNLCAALTAAEACKNKNESITTRCTLVCEKGVFKRMILVDLNCSSGG